ncbi:TPR Domain containing protein [Apiospora saccharicola]|uniref:TPR Domain containing protein n=1 Tax=Apiospora saccharicola TaxID=335842 RepID=A0ABR1UJX7_9PEZI
MKIRVDIHAMSNTASNHLALSEKFMDCLTGVDDRIAKVEQILHLQSQQLQANQFMQVREAYSSKPRLKQQPSFPLGDHKSLTPGSRDNFSIRVTPHLRTCRTDCPCSCHAERSSSSPPIFNTLLGRLFVGYVGLPILSPKCNDEECRGSRSSQVSMEYWFPFSMWSTIVRLHMGYRPDFGPSLHIETLRRVPDSAQSVSFALDGNIEGLKYLFRNGLASPRDVSTTRGYTLLRWALYGKQYDTCVFLVHAGADADYKPIATSDNSPRNKACHFLLEGGLDRTAVDALRTITNGSKYLDDFIDDSKFTQAHKIVLGLSGKSLEKELILNQDQINIQDAMGRTALAWAAACGDSHSVVTLLRYGADPNITDVQLSGPLSNAAAQGQTTCVQFLLDAGADPDPALPKGIRKGSPLNVACRNLRDPLLAKRLLDYGADVDQCGSDGRTGLFHAARNDNSSLAMLLLEYGAGINNLASSGDSPLTTAITHNSHSVLRLFLERWHEYSVCPRLRGPNLLETAAMFADSETVRILAATDHFRVKADKQYTLGDFRGKLLQRPDNTDELIAAFDEFLSIFNAAVDPRQGEDGLAEAGFLPCLGSRTNSLDVNYVPRSFGVACSEVSYDSDDSFHDALDGLEGPNQVLGPVS